MERITERVLGAVLAAVLCVSCAAQESPSAAKPAPAATDGKVQEPAKTEGDKIGAAREALRKAEAEHPGNTQQVAKALNDLVSIERDTGTADTDTLTLVDRLVKIMAATSGPRSKDYIAALVVQADVLLGANRGPEARRNAEEAVAIAVKEFPETSDASAAEDELGMICSRLGDFPCAVRAQQSAIDLTRRIDGNNSFALLADLNNFGALKGRMGDVNGAIEAQEEALAIAYRINPNDNHMGVIENNLGSNYLKVQKFDKAAEHLGRAVDMLNKVYGPESERLMQVHRNLAALYTRTGQFPIAWKTYEFSLSNQHVQYDSQAAAYEKFAQSLAQGGDAKRAIEEGLVSAWMSRETFVLQARTLPERQALAYDAVRAHGLDTSISVALKHPELPVEEIYQEVVRSRALVADEIARRQKNLNANNDPLVAELLKELDQARVDLLAAELPKARQPSSKERVDEATARMEGIERRLAERSSALRNDERVYQVTTADLRHNLPPRSVLISYLAYRRTAVDAVDPAATEIPSYMAFVVHPDSGRIAIFDLGEAAPLNALVSKARAAADAEAHSGGLGSTRNERQYREAALALRQKIWDPLKNELGDATLALLVADGNLNLIPFSSLPDGSGYLVEHGPVIHMLSSERDLVPQGQGPKNQGLLAIGSPAFELSENQPPASPLRGATPSCEEFSRIEFPPLPGTASEISDIGSIWQRWNAAEPSQLVTGQQATLARFLADAGHSRVLHVATHAFLLDKSCGSGNPLLHSGLVFAGGNRRDSDSILTAEQVASLDLNGVDWAVLSACNTGNGELRDGEGVLGLQRAFRVAGTHSVIMTLWPVDDEAARRFMHELYAERLGGHATTADAVWNSSRKMLLARRATGKSTNPWYWAGFVGSGGWD